MSPRQVILLEHVSLDGFLAGPNGEMDWIHLDEELFDAVNSITSTADTALFGRITYSMMEGYWPHAADQPGASRHDVEHSRWLNGATKLVFSNTLESAPWGPSGTATLVRDDPASAVRRLKQQPGADMLLVGSASLARTLIAHGLIDDYWLNLNPVILGGGTPLFPSRPTPLDLTLVASRTFSSGVLSLHYTTTAC
jgi:dihydrofolate reductase